MARSWHRSVPIAVSALPKACPAPLLTPTNEDALTRWAGRPDRWASTAPLRAPPIEAVGTPTTTSGALSGLRFGSDGVLSRLGQTVGASAVQATPPVTGATSRATTATGTANKQR